MPSQDGRYFAGEYGTQWRVYDGQALQQGPLLEITDEANRFGRLSSVTPLCEANRIIGVDDGGKRLVVWEARSGRVLAHLAGLGANFT